jgi:hypothetical protein
MSSRYVLFWFDVEDCTVTQSDDAAKLLAEILIRHGIRGTMKVVGQKARMLRERVRYDVIDALAKHAIGYHTNWHGGRPQPAEYLGPLGWEEGQAEFARREAPGLDDLRDLWGVTPVCYGQPGSNWAPQVFPVLRRWHIPTYVSGFGYVGLHAQPFYYGGMVNTSHMFGPDRQGRPVSHAFGLNFELGEPGVLDEHRRLFAQSFNALEDGGMISIMNHPCTLVLREWFSTDLKSPAQIAAGYEHFEEFIRHVANHPQVRCITADELPALYPDRANGRVFGREELLTLATAVGEEVYFQQQGNLALSAAELLGMFVRFLERELLDGPAPGEVGVYLDGPAASPSATVRELCVSGSALAQAVLQAAAFLRRHGRLPDALTVAGQQVSLAAAYCGLARVVAGVIRGERWPHSLRLTPAGERLTEHVDEAAAHSAWRSVMMLPGFSATGLLEQARLQAWTLKPAILRPR